MIKKTKTIEEIEAHEAEKKARSAYRSAITKVKRIILDICINKSLKVAEMQVDYCKKHPESMVIKSTLSRGEIIAAYEEAL
jgi:hypothetical protein